METLWLVLGASLAALLAASVLVALFEQARHRDPAPPPAAPPPPVARADIDVDALTGPDAAEAPRPTTAPAPGDVEARDLALGEALRRARQPSPDGSWVETTPMVLSASAPAAAEGARPPAPARDTSAA